MSLILFVDDESAVRLNYKTILEHYGHAVDLAESVEEAVRRIRSEREYDLLITDMRMGRESGLDMLREAKKLRPNLEVIVLTGHAEIPNAIEAMRLGALDYITKDTDYKEILVIIEKALEKRALRNEIEVLREQLQRETVRHSIVGSSPSITQVLSRIARIAPTDSRVLITGESGTGKELVAETIHANSGRSTKPFIAINCGAIPNELQESELFGHVRGAFTGALEHKRGLLEAAHHGTVFLDEIGEMSPETQVKLLRFLEKGELFPVGSAEPRRFDVRVLAATNRDLSASIRTGTFREDLFYRLNVVQIHLAPLRERKEDIEAIALSSLEDLNHRTHRKVRSVARDAIQALMEYDWPGNVRELRNVLERAMIFTDSDIIELEHLPEDVFSRRPALAPTASDTQGDSGILALDEVEKRHILEVLQKLGGNKLLTARHLNIATTTLYRKLRMYGIE